MPEARWRWRILAAALIVVSAGLHVRYLCDCPLDLAPDEAHYWHWSRHLDASYYSKGPLIAYLIRGSCELFGGWSRSVCGTELIAVRLPAVACGSLLLAALYVLTVQSFGRERLALAVVAAALTIPVFSLSRTLITIDAPYACCWAWALVLGHRAVFRGGTWAWPALGFVIGLGMLAKFTMLLWPASAGLFLLCSREHRRLLARPGFWMMATIAALCCSPILWWNFHTDWVSFRHVGGQAGVATAEGTPWLRASGPLVFLVGQFGMLLGFWFVVWAGGMIAHRPGREQDPRRLYLWFLSAPQFLFFALFSLKTDVLPNWPATAYISGLVLAAPWLVERLLSGARWKRNGYTASAAVALAAGAAVVLLIHDSAPARPLLASLAGPPTAANALPIRRFDLTCRMRGWRYLGAEINRIADRVRDSGSEPVIAASRWTTASELAFYCDGHPAVYSVGSALWDRQSQFDLWRPNPIADPNHFLGRTFIFVDVGRVPAEILAAFDKVETTQKVNYDEDGVPICIWDVTVCRGFRGFAKLPDRRY